MPGFWNRFRHKAADREGWTLISTLLFLAAGALMLTVLLNGWWTANQATTVSARVLRARAQSQAAVAYGVWWLEQDAAAAQLNTSIPSATLTVPPPANTPAGQVSLTLTDPVSRIVIGGAAAWTVEMGTTWALTATAEDSAGHTVSLNDLSLTWTAAGTGSTPGAVSWVGSGIFQATTPGTVVITVPTVTTTGGQTLPVSSTSVTVTVTSGAPETGSGLAISPTPITLTLGAQQPLTAVYTAGDGSQMSVSTCAWSVSSGAAAVGLSATSTGATATAQAAGAATVACTYTPPGGSLETATTSIDVVPPVRVVRLTPDGTRPDAAVAVTVEVHGSTAQTVRWSGP